MELLIYFRVCHGTPINKNLKTRIVRKSNISLLDIPTNKQLLQKLKSKKFNDSVVLAFLERICYIQNFAKRTRISNVCRDGSRGGGDRLHKTYKSNFSRHDFYNSENNIRDINPFCRPLFCNSSVVKYTSLVLQ